MIVIAEFLLADVVEGEEGIYRLDKNVREIDRDVLKRIQSIRAHINQGRKEESATILIQRQRKKTIKEEG